MLYGCILYGPVYYVLCILCLLTWHYGITIYIYIINQYETGLVCLFHPLLIPHLSKHGKRPLDNYAK